MTAASLPERLADLAVGIGANVQPGQIVAVSADIGLREIVREVAARAYRRGARFVDVNYFDPGVKRARIEHAAPDTLDFVPPWYGRRVHSLGDAHAAGVTIAAAADPHALEGLDPDRLGRDQLPVLAEWMEVLGRRTVNWTIIPFPTRAWAKLVHPELESEDAFERLCREIAHVCRLDEADPAAAWRGRIRELTVVRERLDRLGLDALHYEGPGTDLTVGLLPSSRWLCGSATTVDGLEHLPNVPTEEVFTTPDPNRADGHVRSTKPLVLVDGSIVRGLEVQFEGGSAVRVEAEQGAEVMRLRTARDEGASRLGEVALVDRESRIGQLGTVFYETLLDENATSHIALGSAYEEAVSPEDAQHINRSGTHVDFMVGGDEVDVTGVTRDGRRLPLLRGGAWKV